MLATDSSSANRTRCVTRRTCACSKASTRKALVSLYVRHYPLFQQSYRELGYPNGHFNDRLVEAIDLMLATPESPAALKVVQPKIFYEFADRDLEQLPAGQKLMLRIGRDERGVGEEAAARDSRTRDRTGTATDQRTQ